MSRTVRLSPEVQSGKASFGQLLRAFGGQVPAATETGRRQQKLSDMASANVDDHPTLDVIDLLEARTVGTAGWPHVTNWLCRQRGGVFVPLPQGPEDADGLVRSAFELAGDVGDISRSISDAVSSSSEAGEEVTTGEARAALAHVADLERTTAALRLQLETIIKRESKGDRR